MCEQEDMEHRGIQEEEWKGNRDRLRKTAGEQPLTYLNIIFHQYRARYRELVELNTRGGGEEGDGP